MLEKVETKKTIGKPFEKGLSANPGGRPKGLAKLVRQVSRDGRDPVLLLMDILHGRIKGTRIRDRLDAAKELLDRGYGKSTTHSESEVTVHNDRPLASWSVGDLRKALEMMGKKEADRKSIEGSYTMMKP